MKYSLKTAQAAEKLVEQLLSIPLLEMGSFRNDCRIKIKNKANKLLLHVLLLQHREYLPAKKHLKQEVEAFCFSISEKATSPEKPFTTLELKDMILNEKDVTRANELFEIKTRVTLSLKEAQKELQGPIEDLCRAMSNGSYKLIKSTIEKLWP